MLMLAANATAPAAADLMKSWNEQKRPPRLDSSRATSLHLAPKPSGEKNECDWRAAPTGVFSSAPLLAVHNSGVPFREPYGNRRSHRSPPIASLTLAALLAAVAFALAFAAVRRLTSLNPEPPAIAGVGRARQHAAAAPPRTEAATLAHSDTVTAGSPEAPPASQPPLVAKSPVPFGCVSERACSRQRAQRLPHVARSTQALAIEKEAYESFDPSVLADTQSSAPLERAADGPAPVLDTKPTFATSAPAQRHAPAPSRSTDLELKIISLSAPGSLSTQFVRRALERIRAKLAACYLHAQLAGYDSARGVTVDIRFDERGRARDPRVRGGSSPELDACVADAAAKLISQRPPDTGAVTASWSVALTR